MQRTLTDINTETVTSRDVDLTQNFVERLHQYHRWIESGGALHGIPSGFVGLDNLLHGWQPEQLITLVGRAKAGKSTILMTFAAAAQSSGVPVLFVSFEMSNDEQQSRYDSIISHLSHDKIRTGRLNKQQMADLYKTAKQWANYPSFILSNDITANMTVSGIAAKAAEYNPGLIIVDGVYLMEDESGERRGSPQAITNITRALKRLAQTRRTPVLCTTQVLDWKLGHGKGKKVGKITQGSIGYSSSFAQDSDALLAVEREEGTDIAYISIVIARNAPSDRRVAIEFDWDNGSFEEIDAETEQSATEDPLPARPAAARRDPDTWE
jgi:replicative DNA helicase